MRQSCSASSWLAAMALCIGAGHASCDEPSFDVSAVEYFEKQVRPILVARCHECHTGKSVKGNLRLDARAAALAGGDTGPAIVVGKPDESLLIDAVRYGDIYQMPPTSQLPPEEIRTLEEWIRRGAPWGPEPAEPQEPAAHAFDVSERSKHWSFQPLADPTPPDVARVDWVKTPVDRFVLAKLEAAGVSPARPADRHTLLRRVSFDLIGLPPTPAEVDAFLSDTSPNAYEKVVQRLLASPHYGERWARHWLDLVRFAETHGHEFDFDIPNAFRYRDYVIRALNADLPYNQFVVEHIAGDLLAEPRWTPLDGTNESVVATGWYFFGEAVHSPVDVRADEAARIDNQIDVLSKSFLGLTVSCARCHDHKFDAISTKDYYALAGYLQSSRYQQAPIDSPDLLASELEQLRKIKADRQRLATNFVRERIVPSTSQVSAVLQKQLSLGKAVETSGVDDPFHAWAVLTANSDGNSTSTFAERREAMVREWTARGAEVEAWAAQPLDFGGAGFGAWQSSGAAFSGGVGQPLDWALASPDPSATIRLLTAPTAHSGLLSPKLQGVLRSPTFEIRGPQLWYRVYGTGGKVRLVVDGLQLIRDPIYGGLEFAPPANEPTWHVQDLSKWVGHRAYVELVDDGDGYIALEQVIFSQSEPPKATPIPSLVRMLDDPELTSAAALADKYQRTLDVSLRAWIESDETNAVAGDQSTLISKVVQRGLFEDYKSSDAFIRFKSEMARLDQRQREIEAGITAPRTAPAIADGSAENERVFIRGNHKTLGPEVPRRFLEVLGGTEHAPSNEGSGRLDLARQLISPNCPLVPRVIVNRLWHHHFGAGLVRSPDDFGVMGQPPTHPELLDYLAGELIRNRWSLKHVHRLIVTSNAYQMTSQVDPVADAVDPQNKLWHRRQVQRLEAESVRDAVLFVSGTLNDRMYGPGVMPYLTEFTVGRGRPSQSGPLDGDGRRSVYLNVRRNFLSPLFLAFDYPTPFSTIGRRGSSNVPAQALAMMNNPFITEQASHWADRVLALNDVTPDTRIRLMYAAAFGRPPDESELRAALSFVEANDRQSWRDLAHVLFNVKEFIYIP